METIKTWKIFILTHSILFWHKPFFDLYQNFNTREFYRPTPPTPKFYGSTPPTPKFGPTPPTSFFFDPRLNFVHSHQNLDPCHPCHHAKVWPTPPTLPTSLMLFSRLNWTMQVENYHRGIIYPLNWFKHDKSSSNWYKKMYCRKVIMARRERWLAINMYFLQRNSFPAMLQVI